MNRLSRPCGILNISTLQASKACFRDTFTLLSYIAVHKDLHNLCFSSRVIQIIKSRRMRLAGHVVEKGERGVHTGF
jgi:hypothetical protein